MPAEFHARCCNQGVLLVLVKVRTGDEGTSFQCFSDFMLLLGAAAWDLVLGFARPANEPAGCASSPGSFVLDHAAEQAAGLQSFHFAYDLQLLGGAQWWAAQEIECYAL
jgi:hypothetical protein